MMNMSDTMLPELMKKDGMDGLAHPIDDMLGEHGEITKLIGGEGMHLGGGAGTMTDTGTECMTPDGQEIGVESDMMPRDEVERDHTLVMAGGSEF